MTETEHAEGFAASRLTIDLGAIADNWRVLDELAPEAETGAAVKADAYGLGARQVVPALAAAGCKTFFTAYPDESPDVRAAAPGARIFVLAGLDRSTADTHLEHDLVPVLNCMDDLAVWRAVADQAGRPLPCALHFDTGMNRLGFEPGDARRLSAEPGLLAGLEPVLVMSHFACADTPSNAMNSEQNRRFEVIRGLFPGVPGSLANSAGIFAESGFAHDVTRPGIALYGGAALTGQDGHPDTGPMAHVVTFEARILQVRHANKGETVGYGATATLTRDSRIAIAAAGYADGYMRSASVAGFARHGKAGAFAAVAGIRVPVLGRVSMDLAAFDVTDVPEQVLEDARWIELIGRTASLDEFATAAGTIGYEVLTRIGPRAERVYVGG